MKRNKYIYPGIKVRLCKEFFLSHGYNIEPITIDEYRAGYLQSTVQKKIGADRFEILQRKYDDPVGSAHMTLWGVRNPQGEVIAGISPRHSPTTAASTYEVPFILPEAKRTYAMVALVDHWLAEARARGATLAVFNSLWQPGEPQSWAGVSLF